MEPDSGLASELAKSVIRHGVTWASGALLSAGVITQDQSGQLLSISLAIGLYLFSQGWSFVRKVSAAKAK